MLSIEIHKCQKHKWSSIKHYNEIRIGFGTNKYRLSNIQIAIAIYNRPKPLYEWTVVIYKDSSS